MVAKERFPLADRRIMTHVGRHHDGGFIGNSSICSISFEFVEGLNDAAVHWINVQLKLTLRLCLSLSLFISLTLSPTLPSLLSI